jgi:hypothetical protein
MSLGYEHHDVRLLNPVLPGLGRGYVWLTTNAWMTLELSV